MMELDHPNLLKLEEIHETGNSIYLVIELLEGGMFQAKFRQNVFNSHKDIRLYMFDIMQSLAYLETKEIMHRDLKPDNLIFKTKNEGSKLVLVDFGLSSNVNEPNYLFKRCGTPGFVAPEIINASSTIHTKFSTKCDVFSAGIIFYIFFHPNRLSGRSPFDSNSLDTIVDLNRAAKIDFSLACFLKCDIQAVDLLKKMLKTKPQERIAASEALKHSYFSKLKKDKEEEKDESNVEFGDDETEIAVHIQSYQKNYQQNGARKQPVGSGGSFHCQDKYILGTVTSYNGEHIGEGSVKGISTDSFGNKSTGNAPPRKEDDIKKLTILKQAWSHTSAEPHRNKEMFEDFPEGSDDEGGDQKLMPGETSLRNMIPASLSPHNLEVRSPLKPHQKTSTFKKPPPI